MRGPAGTVRKYCTSQSFAWHAGAPAEVAPEAAAAAAEEAAGRDQPRAADQPLVQPPPEADVADGKGKGKGAKKSQKPRPEPQDPATLAQLKQLRLGCCVVMLR